MNLFRKSIATVALTSMVAVSATPSVGAYSQASLDAANALAEQGVINSQSNAADYNLDQNILRQEVAKVAVNMAEGVSAKSTCAGSFADVSATTPNTWACSYVEALLDAGLVSANVNYNPEANISKAETVKMMLEAAGFEDIFSDVNNWQAEVVATAVTEGVLNASFTDYNTPATRGFVFEMGANSIDAMSMEDDDILGMLGDLIGDDEDDTTSEDTTSEDTTSEEDDTTVVVSGDSSLTVELSPETASSATVPASVSGLPVASFDFTAGSEDVTVSSLVVKRRGLSDKDTLTGLAVFTDEGRASKSKNDSQENNTQATLTLDNGGTVIKAGETKTLTVVADINSIANNVASDEFAIELIDVVASSDVDGVENLVANTMKIGGVDASTITVAQNGSVSNPTLGAEDSDIFKFKLENNTDIDIVMKNLTFKGNGTIDEEEELANFKLYNGGNVVAETASTNGKYLSFDLGEGFTVEENKTEKFIVTADIIGGAGKTIIFYVDKNLDITAEDTQYGYGAGSNITAVDSSNAFNTLTVQAGEITLVDMDPTITTIKEDKKDIILGKVKVVNNAGSNLEVQKFGVRLVVTEVSGNPAPNDKIGDILENIELYDETNGTTFDLGLTGTDDLDAVYHDSDLNITLPTGETVFAIRADTVSNIAGFDGATISASLTSGDVSTTTGGLYIVETEDDTVVTDITPSSLSYKTIDGSESSATVTVLPLSAAKTSVIGSEDVVALEFEVEADESSKVIIDEVAVDGSPAVEVFNNAIVTEVKLYRDSVSEANLLDRVSGSQIASEVATFDGFTTEVPADGKTKFIVTVSILDDSTIAADRVQLQLAAAASISAEDEDGDDVTAAGTFPATSARTITVSGVGTLAVVVDNTDNETDNEQNILGNTTSPYVASYEATATNEGVLLETLVVRADEGGNAVAFETAVSELVIYAGNTEIARESVTSDVTTFDNVNYVVEEGSENLYVKVVTRKIGKDEAGASNTDGYELELNVTEAEGDSSSKDVTVTSIDGDGEVGDSKTFAVVPVKVSAVSFVSSHGGETVASNLTNGENTVAIIAVTTDSSTNTNSTDGSSLKTELENMEITFSTDSAEYDATPDAGDISALTVERIGGVTAAQTVAQLDGTAMADGVVLNTTGINIFKGVALGSDEEIDNGTTAYYVVKATFSGLSSTVNKYVQLKLDNLETASNVEYSSDNSDDNETYNATDNVLELRLGTDSITGPSISSNY